MQKKLFFWFILLTASFVHAIFVNPVLYFLIGFALFPMSGGLGSAVAMSVFYYPFTVIELLVSSVVIHRLLRPYRPQYPRAWAYYVVTLVLLVIAQTFALMLPVLVEKIQNDRTIVRGERTYDFSGEVLISERRTGRDELKMENNVVFWEEHTAELPRNTWEMFFFHFDPATSVGNTVRLGEGIGRTQARDGKVIYEKTKNREVFVYDLATKKTVRSDDREFTYERDTCPSEEKSKIGGRPEEGRSEIIFCDAQTIVYRIVSSDRYRESTLYVLHLDTRTTIAVDENVQARVKDGRLYTWKDTYPADLSERIIYTVNMDTGARTEFLRIYGQEQWDTNGSYAAYFEPYIAKEETDEYVPFYLGQLKLKPATLKQ